MCDNRSLDSRYDMRTMVQYLRSDEHWALIGLCLTTLAITSVVLNFIVIHIFTLPHMRHMLNLLLTAVSVSDIGYLMSIMFNKAAPVYFQRKNFYVPLPAGAIFLAFGSYPFVHIFYTSSLWLVLCASIERFAAICYPLQHFVMRESKRAVVLSLSIFSLAVAINVPAFMEFRLDFKPNYTAHADRYIIQESEHREFFSMYNFAVRGLFHFVGPLTAIGCLNFRTMCVIRRANRYQLAVTGAKAHDVRIAMMMFVYAVFFVLCHVLPTTHYFLESFFQEWYMCDHARLFCILRDLAPLLLVLNTATGFFVYFAFGTKFRRACTELSISHTMFQKLTMTHPACLEPNQTEDN